MANTNPQLYRVATQQLAGLHKLAQLSVKINDREGVSVIQAAKAMIERRITTTSMNLSAIEYLERLINQGHEYPDAEWRTTQLYAESAEQLRYIYDNQCKSGV
jgi:hypothetical protein